jgi:hypothetical protein
MRFFPGLYSDSGVPIFIVRFVSLKKRETLRTKCPCLPVPGKKKAFRSREGEVLAKCPEGAVFAKRPLQEGAAAGKIASGLRV